MAIILPRCRLLPTGFSYLTFFAVVFFEDAHRFGTATFNFGVCFFV
jgi:hypothetical protein